MTISDAYLGQSYCSESANEAQKGDAATHTFQHTVSPAPAAADHLPLLPPLAEHSAPQLLLQHPRVPVLHSVLAAEQDLAVLLLQLELQLPPALPDALPCLGGVAYVQLLGKHLRQELVVLDCLPGCLPGDEVLELKLVRLDWLLVEQLQGQHGRLGLLLLLLRCVALGRALQQPCAPNRLAVAAADGRRRHHDPHCFQCLQSINNGSI